MSASVCRGSHSVGHEAHAHPRVSILRKLQAKVYGAWKVRRLTPKEASSWEPVRLTAIDSTAMQHIPVEVVSSLSKDQVQALRHRQLELWDTARLSAAFPKMNLEQLKTTLLCRLSRVEDRQRFLQLSTSDQKAQLAEFYHSCPRNTVWSQASREVMLLLSPDDGALRGYLSGVINSSSTKSGTWLPSLSSKDLGELLSGLSAPTLGRLYLHDPGLKNRWSSLRPFLRDSLVAILEDELAEWRLPYYDEGDLGQWSVDRIGSLSQRQISLLRFEAIREAWKDEQLLAALPRMSSDWVERLAKLWDFPNLSLNDLQGLPDPVLNALGGLQVLKAVDAVDSDGPNSEAARRLIQKLSDRQLKELAPHFFFRSVGQSKFFIQALTEHQVKALTGGREVDFSFARDYCSIPNLAMDDRFGTHLLYHLLMPQLSAYSLLWLLFSWWNATLHSDDPWKICSHLTSEGRGKVVVKYLFDRKLGADQLAEIEAAMARFDLPAWDVLAKMSAGFEGAKDFWATLSTARVQRLSENSRLDPTLARAVLGRKEWSALAAVVLYQFLPSLEPKDRFELVYGLPAGVLYYWDRFLIETFKEEKWSYKALQSKKRTANLWAAHA